MRTAGACVSFTPDAFSPTGAVTALELAVPPAGLLASTRGGDARVSFRRFAQTFPPDPQGTLATPATATLRIREDLDSRPWHLRLEPQGRLRVCGLR